MKSLHVLMAVVFICTIFSCNSGGYKEPASNENGMSQEAFSPDSLKPGLENIDSTSAIKDSIDSARSK